MAEAPATQVTENGASATQVEEIPGFKVFAGNLAYSTTDEGLKAFFAPVEKDIISAQVILRGTRSAGYGFVSLSSAEAAQKAVDALDKKELDGRQVVVEIAKPADQKDKEKERKPKRRPGRRGSKAVPGEVSEAEANGDAAKPEDAEGTDEAAKPKKKKKKSPRKPKRVRAEGEASDAAAPVAEGEGAEKKQPRPRKARAVRTPRTPRTPRPAGEDPEGEPSKTMLFVANLGFNIDDAGLATLFTDVGVTVNSARIVRRSWGHPRRSKGYGFVDVGGEEQQKKAIELLQGKDVGGRPIAVKIAVNTPQEEEAKEGEASAEPTSAATPVAAA